jgi:hypothetical protein
MARGILVLRRPAPIRRRSDTAGGRFEDSAPRFSNLACPQGLVERRVEAAKDHAVLTEPLKLQAMALAGELGGLAKGPLLFDRLVIQRREQAAAPDFRGIVPGVRKEGPDISSPRPVERAVPHAALDGPRDGLPERPSLPEALEGGEPLVPQGLCRGPDRLLLFEGAALNGRYNLDMMMGAEG